MAQRRLLFAVLCFILCILPGCGRNEGKKEGETGQKEQSQDETSGEEPTLSEEASKQYQFTLPQKGDVVAEFVIQEFGSIFVKLFPKEAPLAVENFITHAKEGYYDGTPFYRIIDDFMIQGGSPEGDPAGGESIWGTEFADEFTDLLNPFRGALCMANHGSDTNGSQFFLVQADAVSVQELSYLLEEGQDMTLQEYIEKNYGIWLSDELIKQYLTYGGTPWLTGYHTVFGQIFDGFDVLDTIAGVPVSGQNPKEPVVLETIRITDWGASTVHPSGTESDGQTTTSDKE